MPHINWSAVRSMLKRIALGQALAFLNSVTGVSTTKLVDNNASYPLLQSITSYLFIFIVYFPLYLYVRFKFRGKAFANYKFLHRWYKYAVLAVVDLEANFCVVFAYQYTNMMSVQLLDCFTVPCVLVLSYFILKMRFAMTHILGCVIAIGGLSMLIALDADGLSRSSSGKKEVLGDCLCLLASALYALSNVLTEWFVKPPKAAPLLQDDDIEAPSELPRVEEEPTREDAEHVPSPTVVEDGQEALPDLDELREDLPNVPAYVPVVENLAMMSFFALIFATIQFFCVEWNKFAPQRSEWTGQDWLFQIVFGVTMLCVYTGMPTLFVVTSAAFANISLLTADVYAIIWNVAIFKIYPTKIFFVAYIIIVLGILLYNLTDVIKIPWCVRFNYPCGEVVDEKSTKKKAQRNTESSEAQKDNIDESYFGIRE